MSDDGPSVRDLGKAIASGERRIKVSETQYVALKALMSVSGLSWTVCAASLGAAVWLFLATPAASGLTAGAGGAISFTGGIVTALGAITFMGVPATLLALGLAIASGGMGIISTLRKKYQISSSGNYLDRRD